MRELELKDISDLIKDNDDLRWMLEPDSVPVWPCFAPAAYNVGANETIEAGDRVLAVISGSGKAARDEKGFIISFAVAEESVVLSFGKMVTGGTCFGMGCVSAHMRTRRFLESQLSASKEQG